MDFMHTATSLKDGIPAGCLKSDQILKLAQQKLLHVTKITSDLTQTARLAGTG
jgi:hypothetical protein